MCLLFVYRLVSINLAEISATNELFLDRKTLEPTSYIDIKPEGLRNILRKVLKGVRVSLGEDKPAV
jgi:hypothetical protein